MGTSYTLIKGISLKENYQIGINTYNIIPIIFPKGNFDINRIKGELSYPLDVYNSTSDLEKMKEKIHEITDLIVENTKELEKI